MSNVFIMIGLSGSGKTTWVRDQIAQYEDASVWSLNNLRMQYAYQELGIGRELDLWEEPTAEAYQAAWEATKEDSGFHEMSNIMMGRMISRATRGAPLFIDNMNLKAGPRRRLSKRMQSKGLKVTGVYLPCSWSDAMRRQQRGLSEETMRAHYDQFTPPVRTDFDFLITKG
ncbi:hypothetical protein D3C87_1422000 [compost metagenome]